MNTNKDIEMAIASLCDDIATNTDAEDNRKRAESILALSISSIIAPYTDEDDERDGLPEGESEAVANIPSPGEHFEYNGIKFVALGIEQGGLLAITEKMLDNELPFDEDNCNDWRKSTLRRYLNTEYIKNFDKAHLLPLVSDLTTDSGQKDYGTSEDYIAILSCDLYRKYRELLPKYNNWWWTITPWHISPSHAYYERLVTTDGNVSYNSAYSSNGVAPACLFNLKIFE